MELDNFFKHVMPVADYFDQSDMLVAVIYHNLISFPYNKSNDFFSHLFLSQVNGERSPTEVYKDFRNAILDILGAQDNHEALLNGVAGMGRGIDDIPGSIVSVETAPSQRKALQNAKQMQTPNKSDILEVNPIMGQNVTMVNRTNTPNTHQHQQPQQPNHATTTTTSTKTTDYPLVIWVIGGPGSNKATLCLKAVGFNPGWGHIR